MWALALIVVNEPIILLQSKHVATVHLLIDLGVNEIATREKACQDLGQGLGQDPGQDLGQDPGQLFPGVTSNLTLFDRNKWTVAMYLCMYARS